MATLTTGTPSSITSAFALLKEHYQDANKIKNMLIPAGPLTKALLERADTSAGGKTIPVPILTANGGGVGSNFAAVYDASGPSTSYAFAVTRSTTYGVYFLGGEVIDASESNKDAFLKDATVELDMKQRAIRQLMAQYIYGDGTGAMAQLNSGITLASTTLSLADPTTCLKFKTGDAIQLLSTWGGGSADLRNSGAIGYVINTFPFATTPYIQVSSTSGGSAQNVSTVWGAAAAGDIIVFNGDLASATNVGGSGPQIPQGIIAWAGGLGGPASTNDSFFGVNRYGQFNLTVQVLDATSSGTNVGSIRSALVLGVAQLLAIGAEPSVIYLHPTGFQRLVDELGSSVRFADSNGNGPGSKGALGFSELALPTPAGNIRVVGDPQCMPAINNSVFSAVGTTYTAAKMAFVLEEDSWDVVSKGEIPFLDDRDGKMMIRVPGLDVFEGQLIAYWQLVSHAPAHNLILMLP